MQKIRDVGNRIKGFENIKTKNVKRFDEWNELKKKVHYSNSHPIANVGEIWWCHFGENIGVEINGKGSRFGRPAIIYKKLGDYMVQIIPLTSKFHRPPFYYHFMLGEKDEYAVFSQIQPYSTSRLYQKIDRLENEKFLEIKRKFLEFESS